MTYQARSSSQVWSEPVKWRTTKVKSRNQSIQQYVNVNRVECCNRVKENQHSKTPWIKGGHYVMLYFHQSCFCRMMIYVSRFVAMCRFRSMRTTSSWGYHKLYNIGINCNLQHVLRHWNNTHNSKTHSILLAFVFGVFNLHCSITSLETAVPVTSVPRMLGNDSEAEPVWTVHGVTVLQVV